MQGNQIDKIDLETKVSSNESIISFQYTLPEALKESMQAFIERHPNWDQYRLIKAALAGFLFQNGIESRSITRLYVSNMFRTNSLN